MPGRRYLPRTAQPASDLSVLAPKPEIGRLAALTDCLLLVAARRPIRRALPPVGRPFGQPGEGRVIAGMRQRPTDIGRIVTADPQLRPRLQKPGQEIEIVTL